MFKQILSKNMYTLWGLLRLLLPVAFVQSCKKIKLGTNIEIVYYIVQIMKYIAFEQRQH